MSPPPSVLTVSLPPSFLAVSPPSVLTVSPPVVITVSPLPPVLAVSLPLSVRPLHECLSEWRELFKLPCAFRYRAIWHLAQLK